MEAYNNQFGVALGLSVIAFIVCSLVVIGIGLYMAD